MWFEITLMSRACVEYYYYIVGLNMCLSWTINDKYSLEYCRDLKCGLASFKVIENGADQ